MLRGFGLGYRGALDGLSRMLADRTTGFGTRLRTVGRSLERRGLVGRSLALIGRWGRVSFPIGWYCVRALSGLSLM